jgi:hypothetical protein
MANLKGLESVVSQLKEERTNLVNSLRHVDAALSVLGRLNGGKTQVQPTRTISASGRKRIAAAPGSRFLCIQSLRGEDTPTMPKSIFLPFEGDYGLAVILSKAFLLASDTEIKDRLILNQIMRE